MGPQKQSSIPRKNISYENMKKEEPRPQTGVLRKGKKEGSGGRVAKFMVGVSHSKGVAKCYQYEGRINGEKFVKFIKEQFPDMF